VVTERWWRARFDARTRWKFPSAKSSRARCRCRKAADVLLRATYALTWRARHGRFVACMTLAQRDLRTTRRVDVRCDCSPPLHAL